MRRGNGVWSYCLAAGLVASLSACGGSDTPTSNPTPTPAPTPPPPVVISQIQGFSIEAGFVSFANFSTTSVGTLEATVDWTFATNDLDVYLTPGSCTFTQLTANQCTMLAFSESVTAKPERVRATNVAVGAYTLWVANAGPGDETLSYQVVFTGNATGGGAPGAASQSAAAAPSFGNVRPRGVVESR
jgi:hypothetical protein